jgi:hypothetical protein
MTCAGIACRRVAWLFARPERWIEMALRTAPAARTSAAPRLRDFEIRSAAELGRCTGAQSFQAIRRGDNLPVLLHKFRPGGALLDLGPVIEDPKPPDFARPFITRFTSVFAVAGSAYLVEPLPACLALPEIWRYVLLNRARQASVIAGILARHLLVAVRERVARQCFDGVLDVENIVLTSEGSFGILTASVPCARGRLWLRRDLQKPDTGDFHSIAAVLHGLLDIETELAYLRNTAALLDPSVREAIVDLAQTIERSGQHVKT